LIIAADINAMAFFHGIVRGNSGSRDHETYIHASKRARAMEDEYWNALKIIHTSQLF
jgi:hypothetical protein